MTADFYTFIAALLILAGLFAIAWGVVSLVKRICNRHKYHFRKLVLLCVVCVICGAFIPDSSRAWTGRRAVLLAEIEVMLALNEPYVWGKKDCSSQMQRLLDKVFPELKATRWFKRTTTEVMATWPWDAVMSLKDLFFGDLLFANSEEYGPAKSAGRDAGATKAVGPASVPVVKQRTTRADFQINHVMMQYVNPGKAVHAGKKRGFSETNIRPYWEPRITLAVRPPYRNTLP